MRVFKRVAITVYIVTAAVLAVTTFMSPSVYSSVWFVTLLALWGVTLVAGMVMTGMWHRLPSFLLHSSFVLMLAGGLVTYVSGEKGYVTMSPGDEVSSFNLESEGVSQLPVTLRLDSFHVEYYPGGVAPRDYVSFIHVDGEPCRISMNNILECDGYRFYQSSYDGRGGTLLTVNHDPWGTGISYAGYMLLAVGGLMLMLWHKWRFMTLLRGLSVVAMLLLCYNVADASSIKGITREQGDSLASRQVIYNGRVAPFNTLARDFVTKLSGSASYRGLSAEQVVASWLLYPKEWQHQPIISIESDELCRRLGIEGGMARMTDLFDDEGRYRLEAMYKGTDRGLDRDILEVDEKVGLVLMLTSDELIVPRGDDVAPLSRAKVAVEIAYNRLPLERIFFMFTLSMAVIAFLAFAMKWRCRRLLVAALYVSLSLQALNYAMRWYVSGSIPLADGYETMQFLSLAVLVLTCVIYRRNEFALPSGMLLAGFAGLVAWLGESNPTITPLLPVLSSPWLSLHVTLVMIAYALLSFTMLNGIVALAMKRERERLMAMSTVLLYPGVVLLGIGIFAGAVWANVSWGRYWGWDPKETWALITFMVYAVPLHTSIAKLRNPRNFHIYLILAFLTVIMTYFGVNLLPSLHAY